MIELKGISKKFSIKEKNIVAVSDVNLKIEQGEIFGVIGYSGAGKSTLVRIINQLTQQTSGDVIVDGICLNKISKNELRLQRRKIGMIFQHFNLLDNATVLENVIFPLEINKYPKDKRNSKALEMLKLVGLEDKAKAYPSQLSGGQKQRVAIARALVNNPNILLCDEATSALDPETTREILDLLLEINKKFNLTIVIITHEMHVVKRVCQRLAVMDKGEVIEYGKVNDIFSNPRNNLTKNFIAITDGFSDVDLVFSKLKEDYPQGTLFKLVFNDKASNQPLISKITRELDLDIGILYGAIDVLNNGKVGNLIVHVNEEFKDLTKLVILLEKEDIKWEVI